MRLTRVAPRRACGKRVTLLQRDEEERGPRHHGHAGEPSADSRPPAARGQSHGGDEGRGEDQLEDEQAHRLPRPARASRLARPLRPARLEGCRPEALRGERHVHVGDAEGRQRVDRGVDDGRRHGDAAGLAQALGAERIAGRRRVHLLDGHRRHVVRARQRVVHQRAGQELALSS